MESRIRPACRRQGKLNVRFDEGELETGYGCDIVTLTDERVRNCEHKLQPVATVPALYSTLLCPKLWRT
ncbi:MAG: hypothetical protein ACUZ8E_14110 [Candidatus Anammoxibacter sp.]